MTPEESRANNHAMQSLGAVCMDQMLNWKGIMESDLEEKNKGKVGRPFRFSDVMIIAIMSLLASTNGTFRYIAGFARSYFESIGLKSPSPSRLLERANILLEEWFTEPDPEIRRLYGDRILAVRADPHVSERVRRCGIDSTGISMSCINRWRRKKWGTGAEDRGWLKLHVLCDTDSGEVLAYAITDETVGDSRLLKVLVKAALSKGHLIDTVYADNAYCSTENWAFVCQESGMGFVTSFRVNTNPRSRGCLARGEAARLWCSLPYDEWKDVSGYGTRWKCECIFSDFKRIFPENVTAASTAGIIRQLAWRLEIFGEYKRIRANMMGVTGNGVVISC